MLNVKLFKQWFQMHIYNFTVFTKRVSFQPQYHFQAAMLHFTFHL